MRQTHHGILTSPRNFVAITGDGGERWSGKGLKESAVTKAVTEHQRGDVTKEVIYASIEVVIVVALRGRRNEVSKRRSAVRQRIKRGDGPPDRVDEERAE